WEVTAGAELRNAKFYCSGPRLPVSVAVAVALGQPKGILLAIGSTRLRADLQFHQLLGGKADHLAQQIGVSTLLNERAQVHHIVGHRWTFHQVELEQPDPTGKTLVTAAILLHHAPGHHQVPADFQDALSRAARETPNLTASDIFAEALQYANGPYGASNPAMDTFRDEVMENLAAEIRTDVDEGRLQPAHANLSTSARQWPDPIGWSGFNLSSCSALGLLPGQMTVLLRLLAQAR